MHSAVCSERTPEKFVTETVPVAHPESIICAADIGRNNGVCSDPEISLLTADAANNLVFRGKLTMLPQQRAVDIGLTYVSGIALYVSSIFEQIFFSYEMRHNDFPSVISA